MPVAHHKKGFVKLRIDPTFVLSFEFIRFKLLCLTVVILFLGLFNLGGSRICSGYRRIFQFFSDHINPRMDSLGWDDQPVFTNPSSLWRNQQHQIGESSMASIPNYGLYKSIEVVLDPSPERQEFQTCDLSLHSEGAKSGGRTTWEEGINDELRFSNLIDRPYVMNPLSSLMEDTDRADQLQAVNGIQDEAGKVGIFMGSLESLDCLLSATNSNTDTSVEDDGISKMFSDCRNLLNFGSASAVSSGESENNGSNQSIVDMAQQVNETDESATQSSSNPCIKPGTSLHTKPSSAKRSRDQQELKFSGTCDYFVLLQSDSYTTEGGFQLISESASNSKKPRLEKHQKSSNISFQRPNCSVSSETDTEAIAQIKEMTYRAAAFRPVNLGAEVVEKPKRKNVRISSDPQTVAARQRRERISERIRVLQRLVPGGCKMDTASMLDEAANYLKFLRLQVKALESLGHKLDPLNCTSTSVLPFSSPPLNQSFSMQTFFPVPKP